MNAGAGAAAALILGALGAALCLYGVNKSREVVGWAIGITLAGATLFAVSIFFLIEGSFPFLG